jgi:putative addiction module component (TIGR02574 family)
VVVIDPDVAEYFPGHDAVNEALRGLAAIINKTTEGRTNGATRTCVRLPVSCNVSHQEEQLAEFVRGAYYYFMRTPAIDIEKLSSEERLRLIENLWESLRTRPDAVPLTRAQRDELDRRLDELDRGETETVPWEEVKRRLRDRAE